MPSKTITEELKESIIDFYLDAPKTIESVAKKFSLSNPTVIKILKDVPKYKKALLNNPELVEDYFSVIDTEKKAYFLGLIVSDGNVFVDEKHIEANRQASISITLDLGDEYLLEAFKNGHDVNAPKDASNNTRFVIMNYFREMAKQGREVDSEIEGRVTVK